ncbi:L,D-transpeptidase family protein [Oceaniserpentilla sp. 4NH20-0058]|uniref:L,D-transpeptidase family protein n=1 Tax=Oceaniserpentilla sp. 4NH20-0058 TaxID=3127660 RepID=UPI00333E594B
MAQESLEYWLYESPNNVAGNISLRYREELDLLYRNNDFQPVWMDHFELSKAGKKLVSSLRHTASDEWKAYRYRISKLQTEIERLSNQPKHAAAIDVLLSDAYIDFAQQVMNNELLPNNGELDHPSFKKVAAPPTTRISSLDVISLLSQSLEQGKLFSLVSQLVPKHKGYERLTKELDRYQEIADSGMWYPLDINTELTEGDRHPQIPRIRWMLQSYGDYHQGSLDWLKPQQATQDPLLLEQDYQAGDQRSTYQLDNDTVAAIQHFQTRNGLTAHGRIDQATLERLNVAPYFMAQRIALNMKRWRYLPKHLGERYILVNMANYRLNFIENGESQLSMKVIIGKEKLRTPVLSETINSVVLAPVWNVPHRIAKRSIIPSAKANPNYLKEHNFKIYEGWQIPAKEIDISQDIDWDGFNARENTYRFVQAPGEENSLGHVKFVIPNDQSIYLHDTNHKELFRYKDRALSSGCIRVEKPFELAHALLKKQNWNRDTIDKTIQKAQTRAVRLKEPVPVYLMYWTTWVDENGQLQVRDDVYKRDQIHGESHKLDSIVL